MHNWPGVPVGTFAIRPGPFFAATDVFRITVRGRGGHAAKPQETHDPIVAASHAVLALQSIASRVIDPVEQVVVSVTSIESSSKADNVIPGAVFLKGTVRSLKESVRDTVEARLGEIVRTTVAAYGCEADVEYNRNYPVMINSEAETDHAAAAAVKVAGECVEAPLVMGGEDFAYLLNARPGAYILVGNGDTASVHSSDYDFNDATIPAGCSWWVEVVESRMPAA